MPLGCIQTHKDGIGYHFLMRFRFYYQVAYSKERRQYAIENVNNFCEYRMKNGQDLQAYCVHVCCDLQHSLARFTGMRISTSKSEASVRVGNESTKQRSSSIVSLGLDHKQRGTRDWPGESEQQEWFCTCFTALS